MPARKNRRSSVKKITWRGHYKVVQLANKTIIKLPLSACVREGDKIIESRKQIYAECRNGKSQLLPFYFQTDLIDLGGLKLELLIKEITEADEMEAYKALSKFHYRDQSLFGRTARLVVQCFHPSYPRTIGYIELTTPFYMSKCRTAVLDAPFSLHGVKWDRWSKDVAREWTNIVVRIARCVIYPEFRGVGLGQLLVKHAKEFAKKHWQVGGVKPLFIEISADMLKFVPFAQNAGMIFIGKTEGNLDRVASDLQYLLTNKDRISSGQIVKEEAFGIVDQQVARMTKAAAVMKKNGWNKSQLIKKLEGISQVSSMKDLEALNGLLSHPKPTYMGGLTEEAHEFLLHRIAVLRPRNGRRPVLKKIERMRESIQVEKLSLTHSSSVRRSRKTFAIQQAFGISPSDINHKVILDLSFEMKAGEVIMIVGPSGAGKTTLLKTLLSGRNRSGAVFIPKTCKPGVFAPLPSNKPIIDALAADKIEDALHMLGVVSLSDAYVYMKKFKELSAGQQYRAMLANLLSSGSNVWVADEFCTNLDPVAANCIAKRLAEIGRRMGAVLIVATAQPELTVQSLVPDKVIRLTTAWENEVLTGDEFIRRLQCKASLFRLPRVEVGKRDMLLDSIPVKGLKGINSPVLVKAGAVTELRYSDAIEGKYQEHTEFSPGIKVARNVNINSSGRLRRALA